MSTAHEIVPGTISSRRTSQRYRSRGSEVVIDAPASRERTAGAPMPIRRAGLLVDGGEPVAVGGQAPTHRLEIRARQFASDRAGATGADGAAVDLDHRADLGAGAAQEDLVRGVELGSVDRPLADLDSEI